MSAMMPMPMPKPERSTHKSKKTKGKKGQSKEGRGETGQASGKDEVLIWSTDEPAETLVWQPGPPEAASGGAVPIDPVAHGGGGVRGEQRNLATLMNDILGGARQQPLAETGDATQRFAAAIGGAANPDVLLAGMYWWSVLNGPASQREPQMIDGADRLLVTHADGTRHSLLVLTQDDSVTEPAKLDFDVSADEILLPLVSRESTVVDLITDRFAKLQGRQAIEAVVEIAENVNFGAVLGPMPDMEHTCLPQDAVAVGINETLKASVGLVFRDGETIYATTALHAVEQSPSEIIVRGAYGRIVAKGIVTDSCLLQFDETPSITIADTFAGIYEGRIPNPYQKVLFHRINGDCVRTKVLSTDMDAYDPDPAGRIRSYTDPVTIPSDSGVALLDEDGTVVGFAYKRTKRDAYVQFSSWIWAQQVANELGIKERCHGLVD
ncbi:hypothetical protein LWC34_18060 [Kibdelosporangium philippinense]|uniref:Trypsin-like peptidase domain-containing protein n=1 Tax=Kibdelosporangium philippinense TaxID=211113 RepID=A0ABS8ZA39_9PSEU|nr:hypothetical protein [Kibdelosporangium philippinense]MCE7004714.1 hypothetical protein [Kibdelosporangium philippinense]